MGKLSRKRRVTKDKLSEFHKNNIRPRSKKMGGGERTWSEWFASFMPGGKKDINETANKFSKVKTDIQTHITALNRSLSEVMPLLEECKTSITSAAAATKAAGAGEQPPAADRPSQFALPAPAPPAPAPPAPTAPQEPPTDDMFTVRGGSQRSAPKKSRKNKHKKK